ncbi:MAG: DUF58 domain-containing protein [Bacteroidota bacterium]|nr:DUF58 domain-containing protein [Bacteroidota bacterium]
MNINPEILSQIKGLELKAKKIIEGFIAGLHKSPYHGFSVEFAEHRPYNTGDDFKHIDWKVYAKKERFYVKQYEEETNLRCFLVLDTSSSMYFKHKAQWTKLEYSAYLAAAIAYLMQCQRDAVGFASFADTLRTILPAKGTRQHLRRIFLEIEPYLTINKGNFTASAAALHELAERIHQRSLVVIFTDLFENIETHDALISALKHLRHRKHEIILFNITEHYTELNLNLEYERYLLEDLESGEQLEISPAQVAQDYRAKVTMYLQRFKQACNEYQIDFESVSTEQPFSEALIHYLKKRSRLG